MRLQPNDADIVLPPSGVGIVTPPSGVEIMLPPSGVDITITDQDNQQSWYPGITILSGTRFQNCVLHSCISWYQQLSLACPGHYCSGNLEQISCHWKTLTKMK